MVLAAPLPMPADVEPGHIYDAKAGDLIPPEGHNRDTRRVKHPSVVLTHPDAEGHVAISQISHNHPEGSNPKPAKDYGIPSDIKTKDGVQKDHEVALNAKKIHKDNLIPLKDTHPLHGHTVTDTHLTNLQSHTGHGKR